MDVYTVLIKSEWTARWKIILEKKSESVGDFIFLLDPDKQVCIRPSPSREVHVRIFSAIESNQLLSFIGKITRLPDGKTSMFSFSSEPRDIITSNYRQYTFLIRKWVGLYCALLEVPMNEIALWINVRVCDWTAESAIIVMQTI